jgi:hypothetical protein
MMRSAKDGSHQGNRDGDAERPAVEAILGLDCFVRARDDDGVEAEQQTSERAGHGALTEEDHCGGFLRSHFLPFGSVEIINTFISTNHISCYDNLAFMKVQLAELSRVV